MKPFIITLILSFSFLANAGTTTNTNTTTAKPLPESQQKEIRWHNYAMQQPAIVVRYQRLQDLQAKYKIADVKLQAKGKLIAAESNAKGTFSVRAFVNNPEYMRLETDVRNIVREIDTTKAEIEVFKAKYELQLVAK